MGVGREGEEVSGHRRRAGMAAGSTGESFRTTCFSLRPTRIFTDAPSRYPRISLRHLLLHGLFVSSEVPWRLSRHV